MVANFGDTQASVRRRAAAHRLAALTDRELEVAAAVGSGASNAEVATKLFMSEATVKRTHVAAVHQATPRTGSKSPSWSTTPDQS